MKRRLAALIMIILCTFSCTVENKGLPLKIGLSEEPRTLNIWFATDANSGKVLSLIYQPLYLRDPVSLKMVPWLAEQMPQFDPANLSYTVRLRRAKWSDGTDVTSEDIAFTGNLIKDFKIPRFRSRWEFIKRIETPDKRTVRFFLTRPKAVFLSRTLTTPIVQKRQWAKVVQKAGKSMKPLRALLNHHPEDPVGCGPYMLKEWRQGAYVHMQRNRHFFGRGKTINGRLLGPHVNDLIFKIYGTTDVAILSLKKGSIDMSWWGIQPGYLDELKEHKGIKVFLSEKSALYFMGFNLRRGPFDDVNLRRAVATLIDKDFIISRILQGYAIKMHSVVPPGNRFWYCPDLPLYGEGLTAEARIKKAYHILKQSGYDWELPPVDHNGNVVKANGLRLPGGKPMGRFTILTPPADYDPHRAMCGMMIQEWLRAFGMPAFARPMSFSSLLQQVKARHDFDLFILGYGRLSLDAGYLGVFFHSANDRERGWNMSGYNNPRFDRLAERSTGLMDINRRRDVILEMQRIILGDVPYVPIYNPMISEAVRTDRFTGWVETLGGIGNIWSFCQVRAVEVND